MERSGYVDRRPDPMDQRISRIYPTPAAVALDEEDRRAVDGYFSRVFQNFSPEELQHMDDLLSRLGQNIRGILEDRPESPRKE